jgi:hypothetical protein
MHLGAVHYQAVVLFVTEKGLYKMYKEYHETPKDAALYKIDT